MKKQIAKTRSNRHLICNINLPFLPYYEIERYLKPQTIFLTFHHRNYYAFFMRRALSTIPITMPDGELLYIVCKKYETMERKDFKFEKLWKGGVWNREGMYRIQQIPSIELVCSEQVKEKYYIKTMYTLEKMYCPISLSQPYKAQFFIGDIALPHRKPLLPIPFTNKIETRELTTLESKSRVFFKHIKRIYYTLYKTRKKFTYNNFVLSKRLLWSTFVYRAGFSLLHPAWFRFPYDYEKGEEQYRPQEVVCKNPRILLNDLSSTGFVQVSKDGTFFEIKQNSYYNPPLLQPTKYSFIFRKSKLFDIVMERIRLQSVMSQLRKTYERPSVVYYPREASHRDITALNEVSKIKNNNRITNDDLFCLLASFDIKEQYSLEQLLQEKRREQKLFPYSNNHLLFRHQQIYMLTLIGLFDRKTADRFVKGEDRERLSEKFLENARQTKVLHAEKWLEQIIRSPSLDMNKYLFRFTLLYLLVHFAKKT